MWFSRFAQLQSSLSLPNCWNVPTNSSSKIFTLENFLDGQFFKIYRNFVDQFHRFFDQFPTSIISGFLRAKKEACTCVRLLCFSQITQFTPSLNYLENLNNIANHQFCCSFSSGFLIREIHRKEPRFESWSTWRRCCASGSICHFAFGIPTWAKFWFPVAHSVTARN